MDSTPLAVDLNQLASFTLESPVDAGHGSAAVGGDMAGDGPPAAGPPRRSRGRQASMKEMRVQQGYSVFEMYCFIAVILGVVGFGLTLVAAKDEVCGNFPDLDYSEGKLTRWPSTISELNSDWQSARGRLFFGFMVAASGLLFVSRTPYELDTLPVEEHNRNNPLDVGVDGMYVCCCADCGLLGRTVTRLRHGCQAHGPKVCCSGDNPMCCAGDSCCANFSHVLTHLRQVTVPIGILFVALCPTVNFWTQEKPGSNVVREVHLTAAAVLFGGGTCVEVLAKMRAHSTAY